jgi:N-acetylglucosamine kinase-like BadF-type ATPase
VGGGGARAVLGWPDGTILGASAAANLDGAIAPLLDLARAGRWVVNAGLAGISRPGRRARALRRLNAFADVAVSSDAEVALWGALPAGEGVAVVAGTGSIALARDAVLGRQARAGGYGYLLGDDGSAFWLGREAVRAALAAAEGRGPPTRLTAVLEGLVAARLNPQRLASLAPLVSRAAADGDPLACAILSQAGKALSQIALAAARSAWPHGPPEDLKVATCGGVWQAGPPLLEPFQSAVTNGLPSAMVVRPVLPPVGGALLLACRRASPDDADPDRVARIAAGLPAHARW